jgi:hypothetical protein
MLENVFTEEMSKKLYQYIFLKKLHVFWAKMSLNYANVGIKMFMFLQNNKQATV